MLLQTIEIEPALRIVQQRAVVGQDEGGVLAVVEPMQGGDEAPTAVEVVASDTAMPIAMEMALAITIGGTTPTVLQATLTAVVAVVVGVEVLAEGEDEVEDVAVLPVAVLPVAAAVVGVQAVLLVIGAVNLDTSPMPVQTIRSVFHFAICYYLFTAMVFTTRRIAIDRLCRKGKEISILCIQGNIPNPEDP